MSSPISRRTFTLGVVAGTAALALPSRALATTAAFFEETTLWDSAVDPLASYHVHGLAVLPDDTVLACIEGRHETCDAGPHDLLLRRSTDGGRTWTPSETIVQTVDGQTWANPTFVVDHETGEVFLFHNNCVRLPENTSCSADSSTFYVMSSTDGGVTWSERRDLTGLFAHFPYDWAMHGAGPGHGIQLHSGRLLVSVSHRTIITGVPTSRRNYGVSCVYSDDHGRTWHSGDAVPMGSDYPTVGEARLVERSDGTVIMNSRPGSGQNWPRSVAVSQDGGLTWSVPRNDNGAGLFNGVDAALIRYTGGPRSRDVDRMLFSRPDAPMRWNMTVSVSYDEGDSFRYSRVVSPGRSFYSDLARLSDGTIILLYGADGELDGSPRRLAAARFNLEWLTQGRDTLATGPALSQHAHDLGHAAPPARVSGGTMTVVREATARRGARAAYQPSAVGDYIEYPFAVGPDGTHELWLRYFRTLDGGLVTVTVDGKTPRNSTLDMTAWRNDGYDVVRLDTLYLRPGLHTIRFTLAGPGRGGGTAMSLDELSLVQAPSPADVREEVTVDNGDFGFQIVSGSWPSSRGVPGYYGFNYLSHAKGTGASAVRWWPVIPGDDDYEVLVSYSAGTNRATNATYVVNHAGGSTPVAVNQRIAGTAEPRGGQWVSLGVFAFRAGLGSDIVLTDAADAVVVADAVRLRRKASR
ncbi:exo-alpha-sialidase [Allorhizocola rhizosphaerae]|uniref:golvesin C-terminal-like domain-containing protein n=1 Tax=Allorhizocola rhizosphaerae TaxID=1872709 RepID=UPI000E3DEF2D|nr:exo-alpha-sialidase [Allorhizocola rhizosphaerae]